MNKSPAFQWYPADYLADMQVRLLSWASRGLYVDLLCYCWREGFIPADSSAIAQLCGCHDLAIIEPCLLLFTEHPDDASKLIHGRLEKERLKQLEHRSERSTAGKKGAETRWGNKKPIKKKADSKANGLANGSAIDLPMAKNSSTSSSSSSTSVLVSTKVDTLSDAEQIYQLYPLKVGKKTAIDSIKKALKKTTKEVLVEAVTAYAKARNGETQYTANPSTWFNQERWLDDRSAWKPKEQKQMSFGMKTTIADRHPNEMKSSSMLEQLRKKSTSYQNETTND